MRCPRCDCGLGSSNWSGAAAHSPYRAQIVQTLDLFECASCQGSWLPFRGVGEALRELVPRVLGARSDADQAALARALRLVKARWDDDHEQMNVVAELRIACPRCQAPMEKLRSRARKLVMYDRCDACAGLWFDEGELERIVEVLGDGLRRVQDALEQSGARR